MYFNCTLIKYTNYKNKNYDIYETVGKLNFNWLSYDIKINASFIKCDNIMVNF